MKNSYQGHRDYPSGTMANWRSQIWVWIAVLAQLKAQKHSRIALLEFELSFLKDACRITFDCEDLQFNSIIEGFGILSIS